MNTKLQEANVLYSKNYTKNDENIYLDILDDLDKDDLEMACINIGTIYYKKSDYIKSKKYYTKALNLNSLNEKIYFNLAMIDLTQKNYDKSIINFKKALNIKNSYINAYINIAIVYKTINDLEKSEYYFKEALKYDKKNSDLYYNYANTLIQKDEFKNAIFCLKQALLFNTNNKSDIYYSFSLVYQNLNLYKEAYLYNIKSLEYDKTNSNAIFAKGICELILGDFKNGWKHYEARWEANNVLRRPLYKLLWYKGESLENKSILVQEEQGFGDNIQFIRYISKLNQKNTKVYLAIRKDLHKLFSFLPNVIIVSDDEKLENIDYFTSIMELPRIFYKNQNEFLYKDKYIRFVKNDKFKIKNANKFNIGFSYQGSTLHKDNEKRNIDLKYFKILFQNQNFDFYSLQYDNNEEIKNYQNKYSNIYDCKKYIEDFNDTANIVSKLDLIISIDSSLVHLCGALGIKTWLVLGYNSEWRWLLNTNKSIWYNSVIIHRQKIKDNFFEVFDRMLFNLKKEN